MPETHPELAMIYVIMSDINFTHINFNANRYTTIKFFFCRSGDLQLYEVSLARAVSVEVDFYFIF